MIVVPFIPSHLEGLVLNEKQKGVMSSFGEDYANILSSGPAFTGIVEGKIIAISGVIQISKSRWQAWALMTDESGGHMKAITREVRKFLDNMDVPRVETPVLRDFEAGHKWMRLLGFKNETPENGMIMYGDDGETFDLYARVK